MSVGSVIDSFLTPGVVLRRSTTGTERNGFFYPGQVEEREIRACVQNTAGKALQMLPPGEMVTELVTIYTQEKINTTRAPDGEPSDRIVYKDRVYKILRVSDWSAIGYYYEALAAAEGQ